MGDVELVAGLRCILVGLQCHAILDALSTYFPGTPILDAARS